MSMRTEIEQARAMVLRYGAAVALNRARHMEVRKGADPQRWKAIQAEIERIAATTWAKA